MAIAIAIAELAAKLLAAGLHEVERALTTDQLRRGELLASMELLGDAPPGHHFNLRAT